LPAAATPAVAGFAACFARHLGADPIGHAHALRVFARRAPDPHGGDLVVAILQQIDKLPAKARSKVLGEGAFGLAQLGRHAEAKAVALRALALPPDGVGGTLTALAALAYAGDLDGALAYAGTDAMRLDVVAFGAALGGKREAAQKLSTQIETAPENVFYKASAIHLKTRVALGEHAALEKALTERTGEPRLFDAAAVVEAAAMSRDARAMALALGAIHATTDVTPRQRVRALLGFAGNAAVGGQRSLLDDAMRALDRELAGAGASLTADERSDYALGAVAAYVTIGDHAIAAQRMTKVERHPAKAMLAQTIAGLAGKWDAITPGTFTDPAMMAEVWAAVLRANPDDATRARVLSSLCP
jgi:hypothetical protein